MTQANDIVAKSPMNRNFGKFKSLVQPYTSPAKFYEFHEIAKLKRKILSITGSE